MPFDPTTLAALAQPTPKPQAPDLAFINAAQQKSVAPPPASDDSKLLQYLTYALQGMDALNSGKHFAHGGQHETNPMMAPFSHGGAPTMMAGFALGDLLRHAMLKNASQGTQNNAEAAQALANLFGILQTNSNGMQHPAAGQAPPSLPPITPGPTTRKAGP